MFGKVGVPLSPHGKDGAPNNVDETADPKVG